MAQEFVILARGCLFFIVRPGPSCVFSPVGVGFIWSTGRDVFDIFLKVFLLDQPFDLFLELIIVFSVMPFDSMKLAPYTCFGTHHVCFRSWRCKYVVYVKDFTLDLLTKSVQGHAYLYRLTYSIECNLVFYGRGVVTIPLMV